VNVAIVGGGISGLVVAYLLSPSHDVTLFEANDRLGGHAHTIDVTLDGTTYAVDTGFVVYEPQTYPGFAALLERLQVATQPSEMSFSVRCGASGLEYGGRSWRSLLAQPRNLVSPTFHRLLRDVLRFNREAPRLLAGDADPDLGAYLDAHRYSLPFREQYLVPMASAIWSMPPARVLDAPARHLVDFFLHHGLLRVRRRPQWRTVAGGARRYVEALTAGFRDHVRLRSPVEQVRRHVGHVEVRTRERSDRFDRVVIATHGSQALRLLADPTRDEREILGAFSEQENDAVVHTDASLLPTSRRAWAAWNVHLDPRTDRVAVTYDMSLLQRLSSPEPICVTLNASASIAPEKMLARMVYHHPVYSRAAVAAQRRHDVLNGANRTYYCGAYWGYGFHEDGVASALAVCRRFEDIAPLVRTG
jgi:predicted NAD/FAD-binding protein